MNHPNLDQAREWARLAVAHETSEVSRVAAELIQSLPDEIVDGHRLRQIIDFQGTSISDDARKDLESLLTPSLPTLAELIEQGNDPQQYQWMQADHSEHGRVIITHPGSTYIYCMKTSGLIGGASRSGADHITPLPDLPRLEWPGNEPEETHFDDLPDEVKSVIEESIEDYRAGNFVDFDSSPRPEDVPAGEVWEVETPFTGGVGYRSPDQSTAWFVTYPNHTERKWNVWADSEITLVSRLVPEDKP